MNCIQVDNAIKKHSVKLGKCLRSAEKYFSQMKQYLMEERCFSPLLNSKFFRFGRVADQFRKLLWSPTGVVTLLHSVFFCQLIESFEDDSKLEIVL